MIRPDDNAIRTAIEKRNPYPKGHKGLDWASGFIYAATHPDADTPLDAELISAETWEGFKSGADWIDNMLTTQESICNMEHS